MFTGLVQDVGVVEGAGKRLSIRARLPYAVPVGGSVAIDGCCLTHVESGQDVFVFELSSETLSRTTLGELCVGARVNVEAALRAGDPIGGHFVQGHVDEVGTFEGVEGQLHMFRVSRNDLLVDKGSIAVNGVSLTVVSPKGGRFGVALVPHTSASTNLGGLVPGDRVNVEFDMLGKYVLQGRKSA